MKISTPSRGEHQPQGKKTKYKQEDKRSLVADFLRLSKLWPFLRADRKAVIGAASLIPIISVLQMAFPLILKDAVDKGIVARNYEHLIYAALVYLAVVVAEYFARGLQSFSMSLAVHRMMRTLRKKLIRHVLSLKCSFHDRSMSGSLVTRATSDFDNLSESLNMGVLTSVVDLAVLAGCVVGMFLLDWQLALATVVILPLVSWIIRWFSLGLKQAMLKARGKIAALNGYTQECFYGISTIKLLTGEESAKKKFERYNVEFRDAQMSSVILDAFMFSVLDGIASITIGLILWLAIAHFSEGLINPNSAVSAGVLVAFVQYIQQLFEPLKQLGNKMAMLQGAFTSIERIFGLLDRDEFVAGTKVVTQLRGDITFEDVSFAYDTATGEKSLRHVSFALSAGQSLALVGATGSGKSTIIKLIAKLYDGYEGRILLDGEDLAELEPESLRRHIAIVPQDIVLFDGSVSYNISLNMPGVTEEKIREAAQLVGAHQFIMRLEGGYNHIIKEQGSNLSHGQRQLIAFARALAREPKLVILDEATSSVDPESENIIQKAIARIIHGRSVIVIAHRLSTIRQCDHILVLDHGEIIEGGDHSELLRRKAAYFKLHEAFA